MSNLTKRAKGKVEEIGGTIEKKIGQVIGNEAMENKGLAHQAEGKALQAAAKAGERAKGTVEEVVGATKAKVGEVIGDDVLEAKGKLQATKGHARKAANKK